MIALIALALAASPDPAALLRSGRVEEAVAALEAAQRRAPLDARVANDLGFAMQRAGRAEDAERWYRRALALDPQRTVAYVNLAWLLAAAPARWDRASQVLALLDDGLARTQNGARAVDLVVAAAEFERSVGRLPQARARLAALDALRLASGQARRVRELRARVDDDERAQRLTDWPEPPITAQDQAALSAAEAALQRGDVRAALSTAEAVRTHAPSSRAAHLVYARALETVGRIDEAARELRVLTQLAPSDAQAWRRLGEILALQGGLLEADAADEALRHALALEPAYGDLWLLRARVAVRQGRPAAALHALDRYRRGGGDSAEAASLETLARAQQSAPRDEAHKLVPAPEPSLAARLWFTAAMNPGEPDPRALLLQALADSPGYVDAAAALFALGVPVPAATERALHDDGRALLELAAQLRRAGAAPEQVAPYLDRAVELGEGEALFARALARMGSGDRGGALLDLIDYAASPQPQHLDDARTLRGQLAAPPRVDADELKARKLLADDQPEAALVALGARCEAGVPAPRLLLLGEVHDFAGEPAAAAKCYQLAARATPEADEPLRRLARAAELAPDAAWKPELERAAARGINDALWALAQTSRDPLPLVERFLAHASPGDRGFAPAQKLRDGLVRTSTLAAKAKEQQRDALAIIAGAALLLVAYALWLTRPLAAALRTAPQLYPGVARAVAELRHDVIKHRLSALDLAGERREDVRRAVTSPEPASRVVARHYDTLRAAARAHGVLLRALRREPVFGPLYRDLLRAETLLARPSGGVEELGAIAERIRALHTPRLASLLRRGPRTRLDAAAVAGLIRDVEAETKRTGATWTPPSIHLRGMEVEFPVERRALSTIFVNLLRNAQAAAQGGAVLVRLEEERDAAGRDLTVLLVGDSSPQPLSLEAIESRESGRGLALVRDLVREWQGHVVVRAAEEPWRKAVGACFPVQPA